MKFFKNVLISIFVLMSYSSVVFSSGVCSESINQLGLVGLDSKSGNALVEIENDIESSCGCDHALFDSAFAKSEMALKILTAAKLENRSVKIDFETEGAIANCNKAFKVFMY